MKKASFIVMVACLIAAGALVAAGNKASKNMRVKVGMEATEFSLTDLEGKKFSLKSYGDKPVLLDFWAAWCVPCLKAIPKLNKLHQKHGKRLAVVGISVDQRGEDVTRHAAEKHRVQYRVAQAGGELGEAYGMEALPHGVVVHKGKIVKILPSLYSYAELEKALKPWL